MMPNTGTPQTISEAIRNGIRDSVYDGSIEGGVLRHVKDFLAQRVTALTESNDPAVVQAGLELWNSLGLSIEFRSHEPDPHEEYLGCG